MLEIISFSLQPHRARTHTHTQLRCPSPGEVFLAKINTLHHGWFFFGGGAHPRCEDHYYMLYPSTCPTNKKISCIGSGLRNEEAAFYSNNESVCGASVRIYGLSNDMGLSCTHSTPHLVNAHGNSVFLRLIVSVQLKPGIVSRQNECGIYFCSVHPMKTADHKLSCFTNSAASFVNYGCL